MKKGLLFLIVISALFWGIYYTSNFTITGRGEEDTAGGLKAPTEAAQGALHRVNLHVLETSIEIFREREKRFPASLEELVDKGYFSEIPESGSSDWSYDPDTGRVE